jgi:type III restriction enzyme
VIVASATMKRPARVVDELNQLKAEGWTEDDLITVVDPKAVAESGLVKSTVLLDGYQAPMEETIDAMIADFRVVEAEAQTAVLGPLKVIYVSKSNIVEGTASSETIRSRRSSIAKRRRSSFGAISPSSAASTPTTSLCTAR